MFTTNDSTCNKHMATPCVMTQVTPVSPKGPSKAVLPAHHADGLCIHHAGCCTDRQDKGSKGSCCGVQPREGYEMDTPEKLDEAKKRKDAGNGLFKQVKCACCHPCLIASS